MALDSQIESAVRATELAQRRKRERHTMLAVLGRSMQQSSPTVYCVWWACVQLVDERHLAGRPCCTPHWDLVPADLQLAYLTTFVPGQGACQSSDAHKRAVEAIIAHSETAAAS